MSFWCDNFPFFFSTLEAFVNFNPTSFRNFLLSRTNGISYSNGLKVLKLQLWGKAMMWGVHERKVTVPCLPSAGFWGCGKSHYVSKLTTGKCQWVTFISWRPFLFRFGLAESGWYVVWKHCECQVISCWHHLCFSGQTSRQRSVSSDSFWGWQRVYAWRVIRAKTWTWRVKVT